MPWKPLPNLARGLHSDPAPAMPPNDEELRDIPNALVDPAHQNKPRQLPIHAHQKWVPVRLAPVAAQSAIAKSALRTDLQREQLAEIVDIQFQQIRKDRLFLFRCRNNLDLRRLLGCIFLHWITD